MFNSSKKILFVSVLLVLSFAFAIISCGKKESKKLYVGTNAEFEPFEYLDNGNIVGFDIDLINEVAKIINAEIEIKNMAFDGLLPALQSKKIDVVIAGMTATEDRKKNVSFTKSYYVSSQAILVNNDNETIKTFEDLASKKVGVVLGFTGDIAVSEITNVAIERYNGASEAVIALKAKKIDAIVLDLEPAKNYALQNTEIKTLDTDLAKEDYAIALRLEDKELLESIDKALDTLKTNGVYDSLMKKYFEKQ